MWYNLPEMARYVVYHIGRVGHVERDTLHASSREEALQIARKKYDDVIKVKTASFHLTGLVLTLAVIALLIILLFGI